MVVLLRSGMSICLKAITVASCSILTFVVCRSIHREIKGLLTFSWLHHLVQPYAAIFFLTQNGILSDTPRGVT
jgi:hypothetical protein